MTNVSDEDRDVVDAPPLAAVWAPESTDWLDVVPEWDGDPYISGDYEDWPKGGASLGVP